MTNNFYENEENGDNDVDSFVSDDLSTDDVDSSLDGDSTKGDQTQDGSSKDELKLAKTETQFVLCSKFMAYLVLFLSAVAAGFTAYYLTREQEHSDFETNVSIAIQPNLGTYPFTHHSCCLYTITV